MLNINILYIYHICICLENGSITLFLYHIHMNHIYLRKDMTKTKGINLIQNNVFVTQCGTNQTVEKANLLIIYCNGTSLRLLFTV
jgi:hypothetical protein